VQSTRCSRWSICGRHRAYSRIAHLRWLKGDLPGDRCDGQAVKAGSPHDAETYAWTLARLSGYYLQTGQAPACSSQTRRTSGRRIILRLVGAAALLPESCAQRSRVAPRYRVESATGYQWWLADALRSTERRRQRANSRVSSRPAVNERSAHVRPFPRHARGRRCKAVRWRGKS